MHFSGLPDGGGGYIDPPDPTQSVGKAFLGVFALDERRRQFFWAQIEAALTDVFRIVEPKLSFAKQRLAALRSKADDPADPDFAAAVYHLDPFQIAKDLAGVAIPTRSQKQSYLKLLKAQSVDFGPVNERDGLYYNRDEVDMVSRQAVSRQTPDDILQPDR